MLKVWNVLVPTASCRGKICGQIQFSYSINVSINASTYLWATSFIYFFHNSILRSLQVQFISSFAIDNRMYNSSTELEYQACQFFFSSPLFNLCGIRINSFSIFLFWRKAAPLNFQDLNYDSICESPPKERFEQGLFLRPQRVAKCSSMHTSADCAFFFTLDIERILFGFTLLLRVVTRVLPQYNILFLRKFRFSRIFTIFQKYF